VRLRLAAAPTRLENGDPLEPPAAVLAAEGFDYASVQVAGARELVDRSPTPSAEARSALVAGRRLLGVPVVAGGAVVSPAAAEELLACGAADLVGIGRGLIADPDWLAKVRAAEVEEIRPCIGCDEGCAGRLALARPLTCILNPEAGRESIGEVAVPPRRPARRVLVVGGGPAGMACARGAALAGHEVTLVERQPRLGGAMGAIAASSGRPGFDAGVRWLERGVERAAVVVALGTDCAPDDLDVGEDGGVSVVIGSRKGHFDLIAVATGASWRSAPVPGLGRVPISARALLGGDHDEVGQSVTIATEADAYAALALATTLAEGGRDVTLVTTERGLASTLDPVNRPAALRRVFGTGIEVRTELRLAAAGRWSATFEDVTTGAPTEIAADTLVVSRPPVPDEELYLAIKGAGAEVVRVGDCVAPRDVANAIYEGERVGRSL
jgi:2,4-dienoyl-CoA reductase (NADPH2)